VRRDERFAPLLLFRFPALGVLERRFELRREERLLADLDFDLLGAFGVLARRANFFRDADRLTLLLVAFGVLLRRFELRRRDALLEVLFDRLGALGVLLRRDVLFRETERLTLLEAFGVLDLRELRREVRRLVLREALRDLDFLGALGVRERREDLFLDVLLLDLFLLSLGVRERRARRLEDRLLVERDVDLDFFGALGVRDLFCFFFDGVFFVSERARFLIPINLFLFSSISALYASRAVTHER